MPANTDHTPIQTAWINFTNSVKLLLIPQPDDRPLDQYLAFRDTIITLVQNEKFLTDLKEAWAPFTDKPKIDVGNALLIEMKAFPLAVEVAQATEKLTWKPKWLSRASTVTGSVKDVIEGLPEYAKSAITLFKELIDLFKGKD